MKLFLLLLASQIAGASVYVAELNKSKCSVIGKTDYGAYVKKALGDSKIEVVLDESGSCGKSAYLMKKENRKRWAVFPDLKGCECYYQANKALEKGK